MMNRFSYFAALVLVAVSSSAAFAEKAPEVDPASMSSAVALVVGGALVLIERYRKAK